MFAIKYLSQRSKHPFYIKFIWIFSHHSWQTNQCFLPDLRSSSSRHRELQDSIRKVVESRRHDGCKKWQSKRLSWFIPGSDVRFDWIVYGLPYLLVALRNEQSWSDIACVFLVIFIGVDETRSLLVTEIDLITKNMDIQQFPHILFPLISIKSLLSGEPLPNLGKFLLNSLGLRLLIFALPNIRDKLVESPHVGGPRHDTTKHALLNFKLYGIISIYPFEHTISSGISKCYLKNLYRSNSGDQEYCNPRSIDCCNCHLLFGCRDKLLHPASENLCKISRYLYAGNPCFKEEDEEQGLDSELL